MRFISLFPLSIFAFCFLMEIIFLLEDN
jgi:hypothetical protein